MSGSTRPPSADPSDLHAIVLAPADLSALELAGLASAAVQHGDTDSTDTWSTRSGSVSSASGQELAEAIQSCSILPSIGDIAVESSSEVYIGSNTHFHGAVTLLVPPSSLPGLLPPSVQVRRSALTEKEKQADDHQPPPSTPTAESREQPAREKRWIEKLQARYAVTILGSMVVLAVMVMIAILVRRDEEKPTPAALHNSSTSLTSATTPTLFPTTATQSSSTSATKCTSCTHSVTSTEPTHPSFAPITRDDWGADPPSGHMDSLMLPVTLLVVQHTGRTSCFTPSTCASLTRAIQRFHMGQCGWLDIGYNFLVGGDGSVLVGRGWKLQGAHTSPWNSMSIGVGLMGNFIGEPSPTEAQRVALELLASQGVLEGALRDDYQVVGACQLKDTDSPGTVGMRWLRTVDHWSNYTTQAARCSTAVKQNERLENGYFDCNSQPNQSNKQCKIAT